MLLPIRLFTDQIISKVCQPVTDFNDPKLETLVQEMVETCMANRGVGLAAPQVGEDKQLAILHVENRTKIMTIINPKIIAHTKEKEKLDEGCLSAPGVTIPMKRYKGVEVEFYNLLGEKIQARFTDYDCRIFLHEFDHLQGKCIANTLTKYVSMLY